MSQFTAHDVGDDNSEQLSRLNQNLETTKQIIGASSTAEYTISSGSITPSVAIFTVDTEASAASDDLSNILTTNLHTGALIAVALENASRVVTLKHEAGGTGQVSLYGNQDRVLSVDSWVLLRLDGTSWVELEINREPEPSTITTEGDLIVGDSGGDESRLAIGTNGHVLTSNGTTAGWSAPSGVSADSVTVDDSAFTNLTGTDAQTVFDDIDDQLDGIPYVRTTNSDFVSDVVINATDIPFASGTWLCFFNDASGETVTIKQIAAGQSFSGAIGAGDTIIGGFTFVGYRIA